MIRDDGEAVKFSGMMAFAMGFSMHVVEIHDADNLPELRRDCMSDDGE